MADPRWKETMSDGKTYETAFVKIMGKDKTVEDFGKGDGEDPEWRSSPGAMGWLNDNYKKKAGKRRKTRKTKKKKRSNKTKRRRARK